ncbi:AMP-binding protein [Streptomonospora nanhaiensis]|uniref:AMP-binding protein n=1 Tax=Streptomonospora nanhaiensis TaxID=1323731 RepID=UPI001C991C06|nr:AMP-binding protein [Streptomonospora nanhaiensis]MBX9389738.1 AMP-binding protein [Streptomonospora nanhaiensis]
MTPFIAELERDRDRVVLHDRRGGLTAGQALDTIRRLARALAGLGHGPGRIAALIGSMTSRLHLLAHAVELTGGGQVEIPDTLPFADQAGLIAECGACLAIADPGGVRRTRLPDLAALPGVRLLTLGPGPGTDLLGTAAALSAAPFPPRARPGDPNRITLTGGTTGRAKPVLRRFRAGPPRTAPGVRELLAGGAPPRLLKTGRLTGLGRALGDAAVAAGGRLITLPGFDPPEVAAVLAEQKATHLVLSPYELRLLLDHLDGSAARRFPHLRSVLSATAATSPALLSRAVDRFGPIVRAGYGQTEAGSVARLEPEDYADGSFEVRRSAGRPLPGVRVEVRDPRGRPREPGERGEIWVHSPRLTTEYWRRPEATAHALRDGWLRTGDVGFLDTDGLLTLLGRASDAMEIAGEVVFAAEVDSWLQEHPAVLESATFDVPDSTGGATLHTAVVTAPGAAAEAGAPELRAWLSRRLDPRRVPSSVLFVPHIPLTYANEPCRDTLRKWHAAG